MPTREQTMQYVTKLMSGDIDIPDKQAQRFGLCEIQYLLDYIYGRRADGSPVTAEVKRTFPSAISPGTLPVADLDLPNTWMPWISLVAPTIKELAEVGERRMMGSGISNASISRIRTALLKVGWTLKE